MILDNYTEDEFKDIVANSSSYADLAKRLGYRSYSGDLYNKLKEFFKDYDCSHFKKCSTPISRYPENVFIKNSTANQSTLRRWFIKGQYVDYKCSICGMEPIWNNKPLTLILDHINGVNNDDRLEDGYVQTVINNYQQREGKIQKPMLKLIIALIAINKYYLILYDV